jgi:hypothetical protein
VLFVANTGFYSEQKRIDEKFFFVSSFSPLRQFWGHSPWPAKHMEHFFTNLGGLTPRFFGLTFQSRRGPNRAVTREGWLEEEKKNGTAAVKKTWKESQTGLPGRYAPDGFRMGSGENPACTVQDSASRSQAEILTAFTSEAGVDGIHDPHRADQKLRGRRKTASPADDIFTAAGRSR